MVLHLTHRHYILESDFHHKKSYMRLEVEELLSVCLSPIFQTPSTKHKRLTPTPSSCASSVAATPGSSTVESMSLSASIGKPLLSDYGIYELPDYDDNRDILLDTALAARIESLETETEHLQSTLSTIQQISGNDALTRFYTGFALYEILLAFFEFLGPAVYKLQYWGNSKRKTSRRRKSMKLDPLNQYFLTLVKLRLNLRVKDIAFRFGISIGLVSKYFTTWICFMYHHLKEINWSPSAEQVVATLPIAFKERYPSTFGIIDDSEIFIDSN